MVDLCSGSVIGRFGVAQIAGLGPSLEVHGAGDPYVRRRLFPLAWLDGVELTLVRGIGFVLAGVLVD
jgi:hypothetical protein